MPNKQLDLSKFQYGSEISGSEIQIFYRLLKNVAFIFLRFYGLSFEVILIYTLKYYICMYISYISDIMHQTHICI